MGNPAPRSIPAQPATPSTHASRAHRHLFSHLSLLSAHSFPSPLPVVTSQCTLETPYPKSLPQILHACPPPPTARHLRNRASPPFPHPASRPVSDQSLPLATPPLHPLATPAHPASSAPSCRPLAAPPFVANPPKNPAQAISRQPAPSGGGLARDSSPFTPTQFPPPGTRPRPRPTPATAGCRAGASRPASRPGLTTPPWQNLTHPRHTPIRPSPPVLWRVPASAEKRPAAPQEFFGKNSYCARGPRFRRSAQRHSPAPASTPPPRPSTLAGTDQASEPV